MLVLQLSLKLCKSYNLFWVVVYFSSAQFIQFETLVFTSVTSLNSETAAATASRSLPHQSAELSSALLDWLFILHAFGRSWSAQLHADRMINNVVCKRFSIQTAEVRWQGEKKTAAGKQPSYNLKYTSTHRVTLTV